MILDFFLNLIYGVVLTITSPLRLAPDVSLPENLTDNLASISAYLNVFSDYLPINTIILILSSYLGIELVIGLYKIIMWVVKRIPTQS